MPNASRRAGEMPASPIRRLFPLAAAAEARGVHVHYLNIGQPDVVTPDGFWRGVEAARSATLAYAPSPGAAELREAALADYARRGLPVAPEDLLVTTGGSEATLFAFLACFDPGDEVVVVEPYYANYSGFATESGVVLKALTTRLEDGFALPGAAEIEATIGPRTRGVLICNPSNPTGTSFRPEELRALAKLARERDLFLIVDEVYRDFNYTDAPLLSVLELEGMERHAVMIDSVSKRLSLCGSRIGFLVSKNPAVMAGANKFAQARLSVATLDQAGAAVALRETPPEYFAQVREEYMRRRDAVLEELASIPGARAAPVNGAFYVIARLPVPDAEAFCKFLLTSFELEGETALLAPAAGFYLTPGLGMDEVRIAYVLEARKLRRACACIRAALAVFPAARAADPTAR